MTMALIVLHAGSNPEKSRADTAVHLAGVLLADN
jgi:hypothetical protein